MISYTHPNELLNQLVSGQLDADRMDYLLRDAYFTGTSYGRFDMEKVLRAMTIKQHRLVVKKAASMRSKTISWRVITCIGRFIIIRSHEALRQC